MNYPYQPYFNPYSQQQIQSQVPQQTLQNMQMQQAYQQSMTSQQNIPQQPAFQQSQQQVQQSIPIQNGGFAIVRSEQEARDYLLAPGTFMTFKNENSQYMYEKSRTFSQLDAPVFKKFRLVEEEDSPVAEVVDIPEDKTQFALEKDLMKLTSEVQMLKDDIEGLRDSVSKRVGRPRKENVDE